MNRSRSYSQQHC